MVCAERERKRHRPIYTVLYKRQPHIDVSLPLFLPPFPSLKIKFKKKKSNLTFLEPAFSTCRWEKILAIFILPSPAQFFPIVESPNLIAQIWVKIGPWFAEGRMTVTKVTDRPTNEQVTQGLPARIPLLTCERASNTEVLF